MLPEEEGETDAGGFSRSPNGVSVLDIGRGTARYIFAVSVLSEDEDEGRVRTGEIQEYMGVSPPSVTEMVSKLDSRGLVDYEKYRGVRLTEEGRNVAERIGWRFCVVSTFFESTLDADADEKTVLDTALALPDEGVRNLRGFVGPSCLELCPESDGETDECAAG